MIAEQLKKAVLQAAIQGKLTEQLPGDGTARDFLAKILAEKERLLNEGSLKKEKPLPAITEDDIPFEIPENWCWVRLGEVIDLIMGQSPDGNAVGNKGLEFHQGKIAFGKKYIQNSNTYCSVPKKIAQPNSILLCVRAPVGKVNITDRELCIGRGLASISPIIIHLQYAFHYFEVMESYFIRNSSGTTFTAIGKDTILYSPFPLPPLAEQKRIVDKLDDILPELEKLSQDETKLEELQKSFPLQLKSSLLQAAIQGKLTDQLPDDGNARDLLEEIKAEKQRLISAGKLKKEKLLPPITEDEIPFDIPDNWVWVKFGDIVSFHLGKTPPRAEVDYWGSDYPWVSIADINDGGITNQTKEKVTQKAFDKIFNGSISPKGSLIMSFKLSIGKTSILGFDAFHNEAIITIKPLVSDKTMKMFLFKLLKFLSTMADSKGAIKGNTLNSTSINSMLIPLPPLPEQKRIVERLQEFLPLCDALE